MNMPRLQQPARQTTSNDGYQHHSPSVIHPVPRAPSLAIVALVCLHAQRSELGPLKVVPADISLQHLETNRCCQHWRQNGPIGSRDLGLLKGCEMPSMLVLLPVLDVKRKVGNVAGRHDDLLDKECQHSKKD
jgi:hypothetical protein